MDLVPLYELVFWSNIKYVRSLPFFCRTALVLCCDSGEVIFMRNTAKMVNALPESEFFSILVMMSAVDVFRCPHFRWIYMMASMIKVECTNGLFFISG